METKDLIEMLEQLIMLPTETEWVEFKIDNFNPQDMGEYISALSNSACLLNKPKGYLVFGVENQTHRIVGTKFKPKQEKKGNQEIENWIATQLEPRIDFVIHEISYKDRPVVLFEIDAANNKPVKFRGVDYVRVGSYKKKLADHPEKERKIWKKGYDWSAQVCQNANINDLDSEATIKARSEFKQKNPKLTSEVDDWDDIHFLNKAKITIDGKITNAAIVLLGKLESEHFISPSIAKLCWILRDADNTEKDYEHFGPPFILNVENIYAKIRNLNYRYLPDRTLFPIEITQYDSWVIREALHNCIAHQDYELKGRINIIEMPEELIFSNKGDFIPGSVETVIQQDSPSEVYRNPFLAQAMVNLNMIDTIGSGIKRMFQLQRKRSFPLPDYDLTQVERVLVKIQGKVLDENYTRLLMEKTDLDLTAVMLLDKVQKRIQITKDEHRFLKSAHLVEGRYPNIFVSAKIAAVTGDKAGYIKYRGFDEKYYKDMILEMIKEHGTVTRSDIDDLLYGKLPEILSPKQKETKINNLLYKMSKTLGLIQNQRAGRRSEWTLAGK